ncbi:hypothetical protein GGF43_001951, partial [Coemansia sp. RSA 2618]
MVASSGFCPDSEGWGPWSVERELDLTTCFEHGIMFPALDVLFLVIAAFRLKELRTHMSLPSAYTKTAAFQAKLALAGAIAAGSATELYILVTQTGITGIANALVAGQVIHVGAFAVAAVMHYREQTKARGSSSILLLFWLVTAILSLITLRTDRESGGVSGKAAGIRRTGQYVSPALMVALFCVELWPRRVSEYVLPEDGAEQPEAR